MTTLDELVANVAKSGLVSRPDLDRALNRLGTTPASDAPLQFVKLLIGQNSLTTYQARKLLGGATRGFFLGGYKILRPLGEGGMGKVYLAESSTDRRRVAIKVLPPKKAAEEERALQRFIREMDLSRRVNHPNIARTLDVGQEGGVYFMIMEYVQGQSLYEVVKREGGGPLRVPDASKFFLKVLDGLEAAHKVGLIHRDLKPSNIMVTPEGDARILDMGLAKAMGEESILTRPNVVIGTLDYASPEQLGDAAKANEKSDLYSIGCTLYFTLAGRPPFEGGDVVNKIYKQRMEDPKPLESVVDGVPSSFAAIVRKLMAKNPNDRYQSVAELRVDLARWTDPATVRAILGAQAEAAKAFRPPPPSLDEDDLRVLIDDDQSPSLPSLRDLGDPTPAAPPVHKPPTLPRPVRVIPDSTSKSGLSPMPDDHEEDDNRWLIQFVGIALALGILAIILISLVQASL